LRTTWEYYSTPRILFGPHSIAKLDGILQSFKAKTVLLVTDQGIVKAGLLEQVTALLNSAAYQVIVYDQAVPEPPISAVMECYAFARTQETPNVIVGLGGGSSIDMAKIVALLLTYGGHPRDYFGEKVIPGPILPLIAIPSTAGTGSEVTSVAVVNDTENNLKVGLSNQYLRPAAALLDPELTLTLPPYVTACAGIDALAHAVEAYLAKDYKYIQAEGEILFVGSAPISDTLALRAIQLISQNLILAVNQGSNLEARSNLLLGSLMAGMAFSNAGTAAAHALAYPIGGMTKSPHGEITGLLLPYVMQYNAMVSREKLLHIAEAFQLGAAGSDPEAVLGQLNDKMFDLLRNIGLPYKLSSIGIRREDIPEIAEKAIAIDRLMRNNPRQPYVESLTGILYSAF